MATNVSRQVQFVRIDSVLEAQKNERGNVRRQQKKVCFHCVLAVYACALAISTYPFFISIFCNQARKLEKKRTAEALKSFIAFLQTYQIGRGDETLQGVVRDNEGFIGNIMAMFEINDKARALHLLESVVRDRMLPLAERSVLQYQIDNLKLLMMNFQRRGIYTDLDVFLQQLRDVDEKRTIDAMLGGFDPANAAQYRGLIDQMRQTTGGRVGLIRANQLHQHEREQLNAFKKNYNNNVERGLGQRSIPASSSEDSEETLELRQLY